MSWSFSFSLYVINGAYISDWEASDDVKPTVVEIDECGPANLISPGFALWLVLVSAIACVVQQPGSVFLFRRSNFYRFSPELGIVDAAAVLILIIRGIWRGYPWYACISAVITVRRGIGHGDLWWREDLAYLAPSAELLQARAERRMRASSTAQNLVTTANASSALPLTAAGAVAALATSLNNNDEEEIAVEDFEDDALELPNDGLRTFLKSKLAPTLAPLSQERVLGAALAAIAIFKVIVVLSTTSNNGVRLTSYLALAYTASYVFFEALTWSILAPPFKNALDRVPAENLLALIHSMDPGDNPSTFPRHGDPNQVSSVFNMTTLNVVNAVASLSASSSAPATTSTNTNSSDTTTPTVARKEWSRAVAVTVLSLGLVGPLLWILILSNIWSPARGAWILCVGAASFLLIRAAGKLMFRLPAFQRFNLDEKRRPAHSHHLPLLVRILLWVWHRSTTVNVYSTIWLGVIAYYYIKVFPGVISQGNDGDITVQKPKWLDWLG